MAIGLSGSKGGIKNKENKDNGIYVDVFEKLIKNGKFLQLVQILFLVLHLWLSVLSILS